MVDCGGIFFLQPSLSDHPAHHSMHDSHVMRVAWAPDATAMASTTADGHVRLWALSWAGTALRSLSTLSGFPYPVEAVAFGPAEEEKDDKPEVEPGHIIIVGIGARNLLAVASGPEIHVRVGFMYDSGAVLSGHKLPIRTLAFSKHDPGMLVSGCAEGLAVVWRRRGKDAAASESWQVDRTIRAVDEDALFPGLRAVAMSPHDADIAVSSEIGRLWTPDLLATGGGDGAVRLWRISTGELVHEMLGHTDEVFALAFSPHDPNVLASGSADGSVSGSLADGATRQLPRCRATPAAIGFVVHKRF